MTAAIFSSFDRLELYTARARRSVELEDYAMALADLAEVHYIADQLWLALEKTNKKEST
jgi:hypothetical protein